MRRLDAALAQHALCNSALRWDPKAASSRRTPRHFAHFDRFWAPVSRRILVRGQFGRQAMLFCHLSCRWVNVTLPTKHDFSALARMWAYNWHAPQIAVSLKRERNGRWHGARSQHMRRVWNYILAACVLMGLIGVAQGMFAAQEAGGAPPSAQQAPRPRGRVERQLQRMAETLNLTDDQVAKIRPILQNRNQQLKDLRADSSLPQGEARAKAAAFRRTARQQIDSILTPKQREKQKAMRRRIAPATTSNPTSQ